MLGRACCSCTIQSRHQKLKNGPAVEEEELELDWRSSDGNSAFADVNEARPFAALASLMTTSLSALASLPRLLKLLRPLLTPSGSVTEPLKNEFESSVKGKEE